MKLEGGGRAPFTPKFRSLTYSKAFSATHLPTVSASVAGILLLPNGSGHVRNLRSELVEIPSPLRSTLHSPSSFFKSPFLLTRVINLFDLSRPLVEDSPKLRLPTPLEILECDYDLTIGHGLGLTWDMKSCVDTLGTWEEIECCFGASKEF